VSSTAACLRQDLRWFLFQTKRVNRAGDYSVAAAWLQHSFAVQPNTTPPAPASTVFENPPVGNALNRPSITLEKSGVY
jgi:hypothetical protein